MKTNKPMLACPNCGAPLRIISPNSLEYDICPFCQQDLTCLLNQMNKELRSSRFFNFLSEWYDYEQLATTEEIAKFLNISERQVQNLSQEGKIGFINISQGDKRIQRRYMPHHLIEFLEHNEEITYNTRNGTQSPNYKEFESSFKENPKQGWIYFLKGPDNQTKIGRTKHIRERPASYIPKLPFPTEIIHTIRTNNRVQAEKDFHNKYSNRHIRGEWFKLSDRDIDEIKQIDTYNYPKKGD